MKKKEIIDELTILHRRIVLTRLNFQVHPNEETKKEVIEAEKALRNLILDNGGTPLL